LAAVLVSVAVVVAGAATAIVLAVQPGRSRPAASGQGTPSSSDWQAATGGTTPAMTSSAAPASTQLAASFHYVPLWPFASQADADAWQLTFRSGGQQPWHLDAGQTALSFTQGYLGYQNVNQVVRVTSAGGEARVGVGFDNPNGQPVTAAVLHLVKLGKGATAPWEVVGTDDTTLTLTTPAYGTTVRSPVTVGGLITGVDESLRVQVRRLGQQAPAGEVGGVPAGGDRTPWTVPVPFTATRGGALTIAVATGGHVATVERFAITGVRY
jgi:hypothetical protein